MQVKNRVIRARGVKIGGVVLLIFLSFWIGSRLGVGGKSHPDTAETAVAHQVDTLWTCSMHPQIKMHKPGKCPICFMDLIPLELGNGGTADGTDATRLTLSENAKALAGIVTAPAVRRGIDTEIGLTGKVALDETKVEMITSRFAGRIDRLYVDYTGVSVKRGDHLAEMYSPELISLQRELIEAAKAVGATTAETSAMVAAGRERNFSAAQEKLRLLGFSEAELEQVLSRETTTDHMTIRAGQKGVVLAKLVQEGSYVQAGTPLFRLGDLTSLWVLLDAYESDIAAIRLGQKVTFTVEAFPGQRFSGTVSFIDQVVDATTRTVTIRVIVANADGRLKPDMFVKAQVNVSLAKTGAVKNNDFRGKWLCPMHLQIVKKAPGTCPICGMPLVRAEELGYVTSGFENVNPLVIPATAPLYTGERSLVYVAVPGQEQPTYEAREVVLGPRVGGWWVVESGLAEGDSVVVNGAFKIDGELQIRAKPSMMNPQEQGNHDRAAE